MHTSCNPVFPGRQVQLTSTSKPVTRFGGLVSLIAFFEWISLAGQISGLMPFRVFVTHRQGDGVELWRDYNQRACIEQHIAELKNDLQADGILFNSAKTTGKNNER